MMPRALNGAHSVLWKDGERVFYRVWPRVMTATGAPCCRGAGDIIDRIQAHTKKAPPRKDRFDLNEAVTEIVEFARSEITRNEVSVQSCLAQWVARVQGDRGQMQQVVLNLILNAVETMSRVDGLRELLISTEQGQTHGVVTVRDSGPGIDPEKRERVFEAFYTTKSNGVGIGLSICRSIIDANGAVCR